VNRETARVAVLAICCVVAIALASATLPTPKQVDSSGGGGSSGGGDQVGLSDEGGSDLLPASNVNVTSGATGPASGFCDPVILNLEVLATLGALVLLGGGLLTRVYDLGVGAVFVVIGTLLLAIIVLLFVLLCGSPDPPALFTDPAAAPSTPGGDGSDDGSGSGSGDDPSPSISLPSFLLLVLVGLAVIGLLVAGLTLRRSDDDDEDPSAEPPGAKLNEEISVAARRAAEKLESEDETALENAVYRAWAEMTDELSVDRPESSTPGEFARAAVEAGMDADDVTELTALFEEVRYGHATPTERREQRAIDALRRIERAYAPDDEPDAGTLRGGGS